MPLSDYHLRRWSLLVRVRDDFTCRVCGERFRSGPNAVHAHHIKAKSVHPDIALELSNGAAICAKHHQPLVHTEDKSWTWWVPMFRRWTRLAKQRKFNEENQWKVKRIRRQR